MMHRRGTILIKSGALVSGIWASLGIQGGEVSWVSDGGREEMCLVRVSSELNSFAREVESGRVSSILRGLTVGLVLLAMLNSVLKAWCKLGYALPPDSKHLLLPGYQSLSEQRRGMSVHCFQMFRGTGTSC